MFFESWSALNRSSLVSDSLGGGRREGKRGIRRPLLGLVEQLEIYEVLCDGRLGLWRGNGHSHWRVGRPGLRELLCGRKGERRRQRGAKARRRMDGRSPWRGGRGEGEGREMSVGNLRIYMTERERERMIRKREEYRPSTTKRKEIVGSRLQRGKVHVRAQD